MILDQVMGLQAFVGLLALRLRAPFFPELVLRRQWRPPLRLVHQIQGDCQCVSTCASMVLQYFGEHVTSVEFRAMVRPTDKSFAGMHFQDLLSAVHPLGYRWFMVGYAGNRFGIRMGVRDIMRSLIGHRPILVELNIGPIGHVVAINGYDSERRTVLYVDPALAPPGQVEISVRRFTEIWHSVHIPGRWAVFTAPRTKQHKK
jgi:hypothetical protein